MRSLGLIKYLALAAIVAALISCAPRNINSVRADSAHATSIAPAVLSDGLHWFRDSAEQKAIYLETYRNAAEAVRRLSQGLAPGSWGVILDIDETILNNSEYQRRLAQTGTSFDEKTWDAWVEEAAGTALPGSKEFVDTVIDDLHGRVALVTNRIGTQCEVTKSNLDRVSVRREQVVCDKTDPKDPNHGNKNPRFKDIENGKLGWPKMNVLIFIGDDIRDFPYLSQKSPGELAHFGTYYFLLPNPMYGSWVDVPRR
jgi:5'-nucleotidase (lipoprotein e(P4) family)